MSNREEIADEAERIAAEKWPEPGLSDGSQAVDMSRDEVADMRRTTYIAGYTAGRTVTAEQIEKAAEAHYGEFCYLSGDPFFMDLPGTTQEFYRMMVEVAFRAAGFPIEVEEE